jgi:uncharacterized protein
MSGRRINVRRTDGSSICYCRIAITRLARVRGLLGLNALDELHGLLISRTRSIHTHFMRFPIDAVFLAADGTVTRIASDVRPWRMRWSRRARHVLELPAGRCRRIGLAVGDRLELANEGAQTFVEYALALVMIVGLVLVGWVALTGALQTAVSATISAF